MHCLGTETVTDEYNKQRCGSKDDPKKAFPIMAMEKVNFGVSHPEKTCKAYSGVMVTINQSVSLKPSTN
jgi:hypothetical protein